MKLKRLSLEPTVLLYIGPHVIARIQGAFNDAFRMLAKLSRWLSANRMFVTSNVPASHAVLRNFVFKFKCRSENVIIKALTDPMIQSNKEFFMFLTNICLCFFLCICLFLYACLQIANVNSADKVP